MIVYSFRLYVAGQSERSRVALANLRMLCENHLKDHYEIDTIDATQQPHLAEQERVLATPAVIRVMPLPQLRVIGDLSDPVRAAAALGLTTPNVLPDLDELFSEWRRP